MVRNLAISIEVLDKGYVKLVDSMGEDSSIVEAARMSTGKGFHGWYWEEDTYADGICRNCNTQHLISTLPETILDNGDSELTCINCWSVDTIVKLSALRIISRSLPSEYTTPKLLGKKGQARDLNLLETLMANRHSSPFEMVECVLEIKAPLMVFAEWKRHRTQSYNEMSGRYTQLPNEHYEIPLERVQKQSTTNKQGSEGIWDETNARIVKDTFKQQQEDVYFFYEQTLRQGLAREVARLNTPLSRYSVMRAKTDLRNWLGFLSLRLDLSAQYEIRQYAIAVAQIIKTLWPKSFELWMEHEFMAERFSRIEMSILRELVSKAKGDLILLGSKWAESNPKVYKRLWNKLQNSKEDQYKEFLDRINI